jgi:predicted ATP-grasp superfamily ATP-dependent carboligase
MLAFLRALAREERVVLVPERDENVDFVLRHWDEVRMHADVPLPADPEAVRRLRRKDLLPLVAAEAGVAAPTTIAVESEAELDGNSLTPPFLLKPVEGQEYALTFGHKAAIAASETEALSLWREAKGKGFDLVVQELIPDSHEHVFSLFTYIGREGEALASVVGRKVRQGPLRFGTSAVFESRFEPGVLDLGLRLLRSVGYRGFAHVEFAQDPRDGVYKVLEVNTRLPVWAGIAMNRPFDVIRVAYDDLCGRDVEPLGVLQENLTWVYLAKDLWVSVQMAKRRELSLRAFLSQHIRTGKVGAVFAVDDPLPALASIGYLRSRL